MPVWPTTHISFHTEGSAGRRPDYNMQNTLGPVAPSQLPIEGYMYELCIALSRLLRGIEAGLQYAYPGSPDGEFHLG